MIKNINPQRNIYGAERSIQKSGLPSPQNVKPAVSAAIRSSASLAVSAGLPSDKLSASIISTARFFSLPLKPQFLAAVRRQAFSADVKQTENSQAGIKQPVSHNDTKNKRAFVLAACAAESKSAELLPKGLEAYAEAVDPGWKKRHEEEKQRDKNKNEESSALKHASVNPSDLKQLALDSSEKNPLLYMLNRLPGKNGQRWLVLPFDFSQDGKHLRVSLRILLDSKNADRAVMLAVDIQPENDQRNLFILESINDKPSMLTVCLPSESMPASESKIKKELSKKFNIPQDKIFFKLLSDDFFCETEQDDFLVFDKTV